MLYHLEQLTEAGLVTVVETSYSVRGNEMDVYAPAADPVVICVGDRGSEDAVTRVVRESEADDEPGDRDEGIAM